MSNLNGLLLESEKTDERLKQAIVSGDFDLMTKIERSKSELNSRIFFEQRNDYAERLNDLRIEKQSALALQTELADELKAQAAVVMEAKSRLYDTEQAYAGITAKQYYVQNQIEQNRLESNRVGALLNSHIKSRLSGIPGELPTNTIDLMENDICELLPN
jgi:chromosome segregation ATPase